MIGVGLGLIIVMPMIVRQRRQAMLDPEAIEALHRRLARLERMLPHTREELMHVLPASITAGICEEVLYRWLPDLVSGAYWVGLITRRGAVRRDLLASGTRIRGRGMLQTGAVGAFLAAVYLVTGSLLAPIVIHAFMDLHSDASPTTSYARDAEDRSATELDEATPDHVAPDRAGCRGRRGVSATYDVVVCGLGAMGSARCARCRADAPRARSRPVLRRRTTRILARPLPHLSARRISSTLPTSR